MPREQDELDHDLLQEILGDGQKSTEKIRKEYLEQSDRDSLAHKVVKRALESMEEEGVVQHTQPEDVKLILWRLEK